MTRTAARVCPEPGCPVLVVDGGGRCPAHVDRRRWAAGARGQRMAAGWEATRRRVLRRDRHRCRLCGAPAAEVDHIRPRSAGGSDDVENLRALCAGCHRRKTQAEAGAGHRRE